MRISDWSSDVCSSYLAEPVAVPVVAPVAPQRHDDDEQREREHVGGELEQPALRDALVAFAELQDVVGHLAVEQAPGGIAERASAGRPDGKGGRRREWRRR